MSTIKIIITTDVACHWCYVGHKRLHRAIEEYKAKRPDISFSFTIMPYMIDKGTNKNGEEYLAV
jgi:predicted DsbA family dithiol-disulfide isomerase